MTVEAIFTKIRKMRRRKREEKKDRKKVRCYKIHQMNDTYFEYCTSAAENRRAEVATYYLILFFRSRDLSDEIEQRERPDRSTV